MAPKVPAPVAPSIFHTDEKGITWSFQPEAKTWAASDGTRCTRSQSFDNVREKTWSWSTPAGASVEKEKPAEPLEFHAAVIEGGLLQTAQKGGPFRFDAVSFRSEWNAAKGEHEILRYKPSAKDAGWSTSTSRLDPVSPAAAAERTDFWGRLAGMAEDMAALNRAERAVADAWVQQKEDASRFASFQGPRDQESWKDIPRPSGRFGSDRDTVLTATLWPTVLPDGPPTLAGWEQEDDGAFTRDGVRLSLKVGSSPEFVVERSVDGQRQPVAAERDWDTALTLANATAACHRDEWPAVEVWDMNMAWLRDPKASPSWPSLHRVLGGAVYRGPETFRSGDRATLYLLTQPLAVPGSGSAPAVRYGATPPPEYPVWTASRGYEVENRMWTGHAPTDEPVMAALNALNLLRAEAVARVSSKEVDDVLKTQRADVVRLAHTDREDGEEPLGTPASALTRWTHWFDRLQAKVQADPARTEWATRLAQAVALAEPASAPRPSPRP